MKIKLPTKAQEWDIVELEALIAEAKRPAPVEGRVYRHVDTTNEEPHGPKGANWSHMLWMHREGTWLVKGRCEIAWHEYDYDDGASGLWKKGLLVPYTPPTPTFQVGDWVRPIKDEGCGGFKNGVWGSAIRRVVEPHRPLDGATWCDFGREGILYAWSNELRHATPEEIAAATRITPNKGMWLKRKKDDAIFLVICKRNNIDDSAVANRIDEPSLYYAELPSLSTEDFEVLTTCPVQGVR